MSGLLSEEAWVEKINKLIETKDSKNTKVINTMLMINNFPQKNNKESNNSKTVYDVEYTNTGVRSQYKLILDNTTNLYSDFYKVNDNDKINKNYWSQTGGKKQKRSRRKMTKRRSTKRRATRRR
jgi:hypothetical protein